MVGSSSADLKSQTFSKVYGRMYFLILYLHSLNLGHIFM